MCNTSENVLKQLNNDDDISGKMFDLHRLSTHDGPGMRTTVFMKGCSLKCAWCHNPESIKCYNELQWISNKCIGCGKCFEACEEGALSHDDEGKIVIDRDKCTRCMKCAKVCPTGAMKVIGYSSTVASVFEEIMQDELFYLNSGGGVTISGGESLLQGDFVHALLKKVHEAGIHTAVDTSLQVNRKIIDQIVPYVDLWLIDMKEMDPKRQVAYIGTSDTLIKQNFEYLLTLLKETDSNATIWIRTPLIPTATARKDNVSSIAEYLNEKNNGYVDLWELCTFNNMCGDKYNKLDIPWTFEQVPLMTEKDKRSYEVLAKEEADGSYEVKVSGLTIKE